MGNLITYVSEWMDDFTAQPFSRVDSLVLSQLCYVHLGGLAPMPQENAPAARLLDLLRAEHFAEMFAGILAPENNKQMLFTLAASPRWRDITVSDYVDRHDAQKIEQFAAMTFHLPGNVHYIAFRGTDTTFLGWKEDFNMAYVSPVPSQTAAVEYLQRIAEKYTGTLMTGGHSKGGNLAVYAALYAKEEVQNRIVKIFSHDGPGFQNEVLHGQNFAAIEQRIDKTLPQSSVVGMLLQSHEAYTIVKSTKVGGFFQHDPFSWVVRNGDFVHQPNLTGTATFRNTTIDAWLQTLPTEKRELLVNAVFAVIDASGAKTFADFSANWQKQVPAMLKAMSAMDPETRETVSEILKALARTGLKNLAPERK